MAKRQHARSRFSSNTAAENAAGNVSTSPLPREGGGVYHLQVAADPGSRKSFDRDFRALGDIFDFTARFVDANAIEESLRYSINLVVEELFTNMVKYNTGGGPAIEIRMEIRSGSLRIELVDDDVEPWDPAEAPVVKVDQPIEDRRAGGLGLYLVRSIVDELKYEYTNRQMKVTAIKNLERRNV
jgi:serine/threonine-protein kinase RsbW